MYIYYMICIYMYRVNPNRCCIKYTNIRFTRARPKARRTWTLPPTLTSAQPPTRVWEVVRAVAVPPSIVVKGALQLLSKRQM